MRDALRDLQAHGIRQPERLHRLMRSAVADQRLDLSGLTVFTEAGSRSYLSTPVLAALGGAARVMAITRDSAYGPARAIAQQLDHLARLCGVADKIQVVGEKTPGTLGQADIITNLGFVRPIDAAAVAMMKPGAVVPLMCEAWEFRNGDVDLAACQEHGVRVVATNEHHPDVDVFEDVGPLVMKLLLEADVEIRKAGVVLISTDPFGDVAEAWLRLNRASVRRFGSLRDPGCAEALASADGLVIADYRSTERFLGPGGQMEVSALQALAPQVAVVHIAGAVDADGLQRAGIPCVPAGPGEPCRMSRTFDALGPRPVVELHCAGLKAAELVARTGTAGSRGDLMHAPEAARRG